MRDWCERRNDFFFLLELWKTLTCLDDTFMLLLRGRFWSEVLICVGIELLQFRVMGMVFLDIKNLAWCSFNSDMVTKWLWFSIH